METIECSFYYLVWYRQQRAALVVKAWYTVYEVVYGELVYIL